MEGRKGGRKERKKKEGRVGREERRRGGKTSFKSSTKSHVNEISGTLLEVKSRWIQAHILVQTPRARFISEAQMFRLLKK